ncbi:MAG: UDP-N-acetylmuramoyl-L-alanyl-D-glutamate--2,6-diaminopimelate ligase [Thermoanaerobaculia bacterium]|nr:UDP-N-acetylmuramoyl-L-alanyl-D-glutamate--2,6-diaminopimelate ligase [Thermoanaerobaculia bacterium]
MKLTELLAGLDVELTSSGGVDVDVTDVQHDSRRVGPGDLFAALPGAIFDGRTFVEEAIERGAVAVLAAQPPLRDVAVPWVLASDARSVLATVAARVHGNPERRLKLVGVTGTNGKSTVVWAVQRVLEAAGCPTGRIGTLACQFRDDDQRAKRTTPESSDLFRLFGKWQRAGAEAVAMEVSSHALASHRVDGLEFDIAVFTNLTQDHLDFHSDLEDYFQTKKRLFAQLRPGGKSVIHVGDPYSRELAREQPDAITCGPGGVVHVTQSHLDLDGIKATLSTPRGELEIESRLVGAYNLENLTTVVGVAEALELDPADIRKGISDIPVVPGRMERVGSEGEFPIFVDFAHTPEALAATLSAVRALTKARLAVVFGCGGDRDRSKRAMMGRVAGELADLPIVTSDNPRSEDPIAILAAIEEGLVASGNRSYRLLPDRRDAIRRALDVVGPGWVLVVAGKGDETGQEAKGVVRPFSDRSEILRALEERHGVPNGG